MQQYKGEGQAVSGGISSGGSPGGTAGRVGEGMVVSGSDCSRLLILSGQGMPCFHHSYLF